MSGDPEQDYFADGVTENIITELSRFRSLFVIARNSSFTYKNKAVDVRSCIPQPEWLSRPEGMCCISMNARSARAGFTTAIQERLLRSGARIMSPP